MAVTLYFDLISQPSRAIYMFLKLNNIAFVENRISLMKGEHKSTEYAQINPFQKVPVLNHDGFKLTESVAILKYLCSAMANVKDHWYPADLKKRARVDEFLAWQHTGLRQNAITYARGKMFGAPEEKLTEFKANLTVCLKQMSLMFLRESKFLNGAEDITIADLLAACEIETALLAGYDQLPPNDPVLNYMDRVRNRTAPVYQQAIMDSMPSRTEENTKF